ncbi:hypothetical protein AAK938_08465 [Aerococcaceae bacterium 50-4]
MTDFNDEILKNFDLSGETYESKFSDLFDDTMVDLNQVVDDLNLHNHVRWFDLKSLLNCHTKENLFYLANFIGFTEDLGRLNSVKKSQVLDKIYGFLKATLEARILALSKEDFYIFYEFARTRESLILNTKDGKHPYLLSKLLPKLIQLGLVYVKVFYDELRVYIPDEVMLILRDYKEIKRKNSPLLSQISYMKTYVNAAANLYGVVEPHVFISWVKGKVAVVPPFESQHEIDDWLITLISISALSEKHYYFAPAEFSSNKFANVAEAAMYDFVLSERPEIEPYMPSESEIKRFAISTFDKNSFIYKRFTKALKKYAVDYQTILELLLAEMVKGTPIFQVLGVLNDEDLLVFESEEDIETFAATVVDLSNDTRKWENFGHKPSEIV